MPCSLRQLSSGHKKHHEVSILSVSIRICVNELSKRYSPFYPPIKKWICSERFFWPPEIRFNPINLSILSRRCCPFLKHPVAATGSFPKNSAICLPLCPCFLKFNSCLPATAANSPSPSSQERGARGMIYCPRLPRAGRRKEAVRRGLIWLIPAW